jgi:cell division protein FtsI (penicillin-binding protein 3)
VAAPAAGKVIARMAPMMGMLPDIQDAPEINQVLAIPMEPGRPPGAPVRGPGTTEPQTAGAGAPESKPGLTVPARTLPPASVRPATRHEAQLMEEGRGDAAAAPSPTSAGEGRGEGDARGTLALSSPASGRGVPVEPVLAAR